MATTARPIEIGSLGVRDTAGAVVASAKIRWYLPGTLTTTTAYTDAACTTPATAPLTANAGGQFTLYVLAPVRLIIKDSTETTTYYDDIPSLNRANSVYVTNANWNSGAETTLDAILTTMGSNLGADGKWLESAGATAIAYSTVLGQLFVPVTAFGAVGDGTTDDTAAVQAANDRVEARGGGYVYFPKGTYRINSAITIDTAGVIWWGAGRGVAIIKNFGTTTNAVTVNVSGDCKGGFRDLSITANTTSSGAGISFTAGNNARIERVGVALHRTGIGTASVTAANLRDIVIDSTDDNASAVGVSLGARGRLTDGEITSGTDNGTGVVASGADARVLDTYVTNFATAITLSGQSASATGCYITGPTTGVTASGTDSSARNCSLFNATTGFSLTGTRAVASGCSTDTATTGYSLGVANATVLNCSATGSTTGFSVGAFAGCRVIGCTSTNATADLSVNASATLLVEHSNIFTTLSDSATTPHSWMKDRGKVDKVTKVTDATTTPSITPTPQTCDIYVAELTSAGVMSSITVNNTSTTGLVDGQRLTIVLQRAAGSGSPTPAWGSQYQINGGSGPAGFGNPNNLTAEFNWRSGIAKWVPRFPAAWAAVATGNIW